jgi:hypothetical protein
MAAPLYSLISQRGRARKAAARPSHSDGAEVTPELSEGGETLISQVFPERSELVRLGNSYHAQLVTGSAFTFVNAWPTTRAEVIIFNRDASRSYLIDRVWMLNITSQAGAQPFALIGQILPASHVATIATAADVTTVLRRNLLGKSTGVGSSATFAIANTAFAIANQWFQLAQNVFPMTTNLGGSCSAEVFGRIIVPPGGGFALAGVAGTAAGTAILGLEWHEVNLTLP